LNGTFLFYPRKSGFDRLGLKVPAGPPSNEHFPYFLQNKNNPYPYLF